MKIIKKIFNSILKRSQIARNITKPFINPTDLFINNVNFRGFFQVPTNDKKKYYLYNNKFYLENYIFWKGIDIFNWELNSRKIWIELSKYSNVIFDIGANTGIYAILSKVYNEQAIIYAFEPQPNIFNVLQKNINYNKYNIIAEKIALSNQTGDMPFYNYGSKQTFLNSNTTAGSLNKDWRSHKPNHQSIIVPAMKLKDYIISNKITKIDLIKIDVNDNGYSVIKCLEQIIKRDKPALLVETDNDIYKIVKILKKYNYDKYSFSIKKNSFFKVNKKYPLNTYFLKSKHLN